MNRLLSNILQSLERDAGLPISARVAKGVRYATAIASAPVWLRECNRVGNRPRTMGRPRIDNRGTIEIGNDLVLNSAFSPVELCAVEGGRIEVGSGVAINFGSSITARSLVKLGDKVSLGPYCILSDSDLPAGGEGGGGEPKPIEIGEGAWLAGRVTVLPGTTIGAGSVITAGSIVSGAIPAGVVAGGSPARVLRKISRGEGGNGATAPEKPAAVAEAPAAAPRPQPAHRGYLVSDFTVNELAEQMATPLDGPALHGEVAPFGQVVQCLMSPPPEDAKDFLVVWTRPQSAVPSFQKVLSFEAVPEAQLLEEVDAFVKLVAEAAGRYRFAFVPTWTLSPHQRGLGFNDARPGGAARALAAMNLRLMDGLAAAGSNAHVLEAERWVGAAGRAQASAKLWYLGKVAFHPEVFALAARDIQAAVRGLTGGARKLLLLDLDDTLWGGIVGDAGWQNLKLGGHDSQGEAFADFQRLCKDLTRRGVVLGIVSKNEESVALEAIRSHPGMVLKESDFVGWRINWKDKAANIAELAAELNLGLQSVVFIDDNPVERARVREALPEVLVPEWPEDKLLYPWTFQQLRCFDAPAVSKEDAERTQLYAAERQRESMKAQVGSIDDWLKGLGMAVTAEPLGAANLARTAQLLNKTNQMNLSTRRLTEAELSAWVKGPGRRLWAVSVADKFGDAGLTGIVSTEASGDACQVVDFVLSCRVMGRRVEEAMIHLAVEHARRSGLKSVRAKLLPTAKNKPCADFWAQQSRFEKGGENEFSWDAGKPYPAPDSLQLRVQEAG
ncbi:MAG TPA: HAD-IIIC family phosphatase [Myxococcales bacterium]|nr:HAD-IIIC family phosphatase [Myxococcales bacterium]